MRSIPIFTLRPALAVAALLVAGFVVPLAQGETPPQYTITQVGLTGPGYEYSTPGGIYRYNNYPRLNASGQVIGDSARYNASGGWLGMDSWFYNGSSTQLIGLTGSGYEYAYTGPGGGTYRESGARAINNAGHVVGGTGRYTALGDDLGFDAWFFNGSSTQLIGLTGSGYEYTTADGTFRRSYGNFDLSGRVSGFSDRYNASGASLGSDRWIFDGTSLQPITGLTGSEYQYTYGGPGGGIYRSSDAQVINPAGQMVGSTKRFNALGHSLGSDGWFYNGTSYQLMGLTGSGYEYTYTGPGGGTVREEGDIHYNQAGQFAGNGSRYSASGHDLGQDAWIYNGSSAQAIGLTGVGYDYAVTGGTYHSNDTSGVNASGKVLGRAERNSAAGDFLGYDAWFYNGSSTQRIGLTGSGYEYATVGGTYREADYHFQLNDSGKVVGHTLRFDASGNSLGQDTWIYNGSSTQLIGLTGSGYEYTTAAGTYRQGEFEQLTSDGQIVGHAKRYSAAGADLGQAAWLYDDNTHTTTPLEFSFRSSDNYSFTQPQFLTDTGVLVGRYELFSGASDLGPRAFWWSEGGGFYDLGALIDGGLSAAGWQYLADAFRDDPGADLIPPVGWPTYLTASGLTIGQTNGEDGQGRTFALLTAVPEPSSLTILTIGGLMLRRRRR